MFFVVPTLTLLLPASLTDHFVQYLPSNLGGALTGGRSGLAHSLAPWTGFAVLCGYAVILVIGGGSYGVLYAFAGVCAIIGGLAILPVKRVR